MRILDLEERTGLERATVRFYEKMGLIAPSRTENGYREYSEADYDQLLKIKLLRQLGLSVETIKALQQGNEDFPSAMEEQIRQLSQTIAQQKIARDVCSQLYAAGVNYESMDADRYLTILQDEQSKVSAVSAAPYQDSSGFEIHPIRRYTARILDFLLLSVLLQFLLFVVFRIRPLPRVSEIGNALGTLAFWLLSIPVNALFLHFTCTTPGKWIMGIRVYFFEGGRLPFLWALDREWRVFRYGMGFCIPIWTWICQLKAWWRLTGNTPVRFALTYEMIGPQEMLWDDQSELTYSLWEYETKGILSLIGAICVLIGLTAATILDGVKPKYRGDDLTVAQFASNYNDLTAMLDPDTTYQQLDSDGTFLEIPQYSSGIVLELGQTTRSVFYETEDGFIRKIQYACNIESPFPIPNPISDHCSLFLINAVLSQGKTNTFQLKRFAQHLTAWGAMEDGHETHGNLEVIWNTEPENCSLSNSLYYSPGTDEDFKLHFTMELIIHPQ